MDTGILTDRDERLATLKWMLDYHQRLTLQADAKLGFVIAIEAALLGVFATRMPDSIVAYQRGTHPVIVLGLLILSAAVCVVATGVATVGLAPRIKGRGRLVSFAGLQDLAALYDQHAATKLLNYLGERNGERALIDVCDSAIAIARIVAVKFRMVKASLVAAFASLIIYVLAQVVTVWTTPSP